MRQPRSARLPGELGDGSIFCVLHVAGAPETERAGAGAQQYRPALSREGAAGAGRAVPPRDRTGRAGAPRSPRQALAAPRDAREEEAAPARPQPARAKLRTLPGRSAESWSSDRRTAGVRRGQQDALHGAGCGREES